MVRENMSKILRAISIPSIIALQVDKTGKKDSLKHILINDLLRYLLESNRGYSFVAGQRNIDLEGKRFCISLILYNIRLKCFVLVSIRTSRCSAADYALMDKCVRYFDDHRKTQNDKPTL